MRDLSWIKRSVPTSLLAVMDTACGFYPQKTTHYLPVSSVTVALTIPAPRRDHCPTYPTRFSAPICTSYLP